MNKKTQKIGHNALYIISTAFFITITTIFPLYITRTHYHHITGEKANFFLVTTILASLAVLIVLFLTTQRFQVKDYFISNEPKRPLSVAEWAAAAFALLALLSSIFSPHGRAVWSGAYGRHEGFWVILCYVLTFFIISRFYKPKRWHILVFAAGSTLVSLYGVLQFLDYDVLINSGFFTSISELNATQANQILPPLTRTFRTTLGNVNIVSAYATFAATLFTWLFAGEKSRWSWAYLVPSTLAFFLLLITRGDAGWVGIIAAMGLTIPYILAERQRLGKIFIVMGSWSAAFAAYNVYVVSLEPTFYAHAFSWAECWFIYYFNPANITLLLTIAVICVAIGLALVLVTIKKWPAKVMKIGGIVLIGLALIGGFVFIQIEGARREGNPNDIIWQAREITRGRMEDHFGSDRGFVWRGAAAILADRPFLGSGPATFRLAIGEEFQELSEERYGVIFDTPHNVYLNTAITLGIPALAAFLTLIGSLFLPTLKRAFDRPLLLAFGAAAFAYLAQGLFQVDTPIDRPLLWLAMGVMAGELWRFKIEQSVPAPKRHRPAYRFFKRIFDFVMSLIALIIFSIPAIILSVLIKLGSKGPIFFKQKRIGLDKREFSIYKFRTMRTDTPKDVPTHLLDNPDVHITRLGRFMRKTSLDELPQLINILKGDMSIVGPRPALWNQYDLIEQRDTYNANSVRPGLTGLAQTKGRDELPIPIKARYDGEYIKKMGFILDAKIIFRTFLQVLRSEGVKEGTDE